MAKGVGLILRRHWKRRLWLDVCCGWCQGGATTRGCLMCGEAWDQLQQAAPWRHPDYGPLERQALGDAQNYMVSPLADPAAVGVLLDLLEDLLGERPVWEEVTPW